MTELGLSYYRQEQLARADNWYPIVQGLNPDVVDIDSLWQLSRGTIYEVPREPFRIAARNYRDHESSLELVNRLDDSSLIPRVWHKDGYQHMSDNYMYVVTWTGRDSETGLFRDQSTTIHGDEPLTIGEINEQADEKLLAGNYGLDIADLSSTISTAYHKQGAAW